MDRAARQGAIEYLLVLAVLAPAVGGGLALFGEELRPAPGLTGSPAAGAPR